MPNDLKNINGQFDDLAGSLSTLSSKFTSFTSSLQAVIFLLDLVSTSFGVLIDKSMKLETIKLQLDFTSLSKGFDPLTIQDVVSGLDMVQNGLMDIGSASLAMKDLLDQNFTLEQSVVLLNRFGNAAAGSKNPALSFEDAVLSITNGLKTGNTVLMKHGGLLGDVSNKLVDASGRQREFSEISGDAQLRMDLYNSVIKDTNVQFGNMQKLANSSEGTFGRFNKAVDTLAATFGTTLTNALERPLKLLTRIIEITNNNSALKFIASWQLFGINALIPDSKPSSQGGKGGGRSSDDILTDIKKLEAQIQEEHKKLSTNEDGSVDKRFKPLSGVDVFIKALNLQVEYLKNKGEEINYETLITATKEKIAEQDKNSIEGLEKINELYEVQNKLIAEQEKLKIKSEKVETRPGSEETKAQKADKKDKTNFADVLAEKFKQGLDVANEIVKVLKIESYTFFAQMVDFLNKALPIAETAGNVLKFIGLVSTGGLSGAFGFLGSVFSIITSFLGFASGGVVPGSGNRDTIPAMLTPGEFVISKPNVSRLISTFGNNFLSFLNPSTMLPSLPGHYALGGMVSNMPAPANINLKVEFDDMKLKLNTLYTAVKKQQTIVKRGHLLQ
jgi:hypothetical protein